MTDPVADLSSAVSETAAALAGNGRPLQPKLDRPPRPDFGDYSTNAAMLLAPSLGEPPRAIAQRLGDALGERLGAAVERVEIAGPGFLNLFMADGWYLDALASMREVGERFGAGDADERVQVEFVSANPTGPITVASARHAAYGDSLARILELAGNRVDREYYVNDAGSQVRKFGEAIRARARGEEPEEYRGDYVAELAGRIDGAAEAEADELAQQGIALMLEQVERTLARFRVHMDRFFSERSLHATGAVDQVLGRLDGIYEHDGAVWLRTTAQGDDKDRVLRRSDGELTYFATDIAYHADKLARAYDHAINVLGPDHHGYLKRMPGGVGGARRRPGRLRDRDHAAGQPARGRRAGADVQARRRDRLPRRPCSTTSASTPHAGTWPRAATTRASTSTWSSPAASHRTTRSTTSSTPTPASPSILRKAGDDRVAAALGADLRQSPERFHPSARALIKRLLELPSEVSEAALRRAPHRMTAYAHETAQEFSAFYRDCRVVGAAEEGGDEDVRIAICVQARDVIARSLDLVGVEAPDSM